MEALGDAVRGRMARRSTEERTEAVLALPSGKASVDPIARRFGVRAGAVVEGRREQALESIGEEMRQGTGKSARKLALERDLAVGPEGRVHAALRILVFGEIIPSAR